MLNCVLCVETELKKNPERSFTARQMRDHILRSYGHTFSLSEVRRALKGTRDDGYSVRTRNGRMAYLYTIANP